MASKTMEMWSAVGSMMASLMFIWTIISPYFPVEVLDYFHKYVGKLKKYFNPGIQVTIFEYTTADRYNKSKAFCAVESYLGQTSWKFAKKLNAQCARNGTKLQFTLDDQEEVPVIFQGVKALWTSSSIARSPKSCDESVNRLYRLKFHSRDREFITETYLDHVIKNGTEIISRNKQRYLYTNSNGMWSCIVFEHPANFETLAMEKKKKQEIFEDLLNFSASKDYYARIGKAWKRGYLLYGPPGTGKSTMIAAISNLLNYNVYDLELMAVRSNTELRKLLIQTKSKSVIVIEDIDCSLDLTGQREEAEQNIAQDNESKSNKTNAASGKYEKEGSKVTLSGLLNFIDGLWSASGGERIIEFTTNYPDRLDPALIRAGRMDKHIELSYCCFGGFKVLAKNYMMIETHPLFEKIRRLLEETKITPADVAENLMPKSLGEEVEKRLEKLIQVLEEAKKAETLERAKKEMQKPEEQEQELQTH